MPSINKTLLSLLGFLAVSSLHSVHAIDDKIAPHTLMNLQSGSEGITKLKDFDKVWYGASLDETLVKQKSEAGEPMAPGDDEENWIQPDGYGPYCSKSIAKPAKWDNGGDLSKVYWAFDADNTETAYVVLKDINKDEAYKDGSETSMVSPDSYQIEYPSGLDVPKEFQDALKSIGEESIFNMINPYEYAADDDIWARDLIEVFGYADHPTSEGN